MGRRKVNIGVRVAYQTWKPMKGYSAGFYRIQISWNQYQHSLSILERKPRINRIVGSALAELFNEPRVTAYALANGAACYQNARSARFIVVHAVDRNKAKRCAEELGLPKLVAQ